MHEAAIAQSVLRIVASRLHILPGTIVHRVRVRVGSFRNVDPESFEFAFDCLKESFDGCHAAQLDIELIAASAECSENEHKYEPLIEQAFRCPFCNSGMGRLLTGEELEMSGYTVMQVEEPTQERQQEQCYARDNG